MKKSLLRGLLTGSMALALLTSMPVAPSQAQSSSTTTITTTTTTRTNAPMTITRVRYPATVTVINGENVVLDAYGSPVTLPRTWATYEYDGRLVDVSQLQAGQKVMVVYPDVNGSVSSYNGGMLLVTDSRGASYMIPRSAIRQEYYGNRVYVRLSNGNYALVPLRTALDLQTNNGAVIVSSLPDGATLAPHASSSDDVMSGRNRGINFSEGVRQQKDPSKLIQDQSLDGDSNF